MEMDWLRQHFRFHKVERQGAVALLAVIVVVAAVDLALNLWPQQAWQPDIAIIDAAIDSIDDNLAHEVNFARLDPPKKTFNPFPFDPNMLDSAGWVEMGFSPRQASVIVRYRSRSGGFRDTAHMARMGILADKMEALGPFIKFDPSTLPKQRPERAFTKFEPGPAPKPKPKVRINTADTIELATLPGIGAAFAGRIARHRQKLGGYHSLNQLAEVYGMDSARLALIMPRIELDSVPLRTININTSITDSLAKHPYIGWKLAKVIVAYRQQHGRFRSVDGLKQIVILSEEKFKQIEPYVSVSE